MKKLSENTIKDIIRTISNMVTGREPENISTKDEMFINSKGELIEQTRFELDMGSGKFIRGTVEHPPEDKSIEVIEPKIEKERNKSIEVIEPKIEKERNKFMQEHYERMNVSKDIEVLPNVKEFQDLILIGIEDIDYEDFYWLCGLLGNLPLLLNDDYCTLYRVTRFDNIQESNFYKNIKSRSCCTEYDAVHTDSPSGKHYKIGCNYKHAYRPNEEYGE